jgi:hypothetical protein
MLQKRMVWCPNVLLLEMGTQGSFPQAEIETIVHSFRTINQLLFVEMGDQLAANYVTQIVIDTPNYAIYRVVDFMKLFSNQFKPKDKNFYYYVIDVRPEHLKSAFVHFLDILGFDYPIICMVRALSEFIQPAMVVYPDVETFDQEKSAFENLENALLFQLSTLANQNFTYKAHQII